MAAPQTARAELSAEPLLHLVVRKGARVAWEHHGDELEIRVQASATAAEAKSHIEQRVGVPSSDVRLVYNGQARTACLPSWPCLQPQRSRSSSAMLCAGAAVQ